MAGIAEIFRSMLGGGGNDAGFRQWYAERAARNGLNPNPDDPLHHYDYRAAYAAGAEPGADGHWPSQYKTEGHPRMVVDGMNTKTGLPERYENRMQPVGTGAGSTLRSSSGAPVMSRFGTAAPIESRNLADAVRLALMKPQPDITGVPLDDAPTVKTWQPQDIAGSALEDGVTVKPFYEPPIDAVPLEPEVLPWQRMAQSLNARDSQADDLVNHNPMPLNMQLEPIPVGVLNPQLETLPWHRTPVSLGQSPPQPWKPYSMYDAGSIDIARRLAEQLMRY